MTPSTFGIAVVALNFVGKPQLRQVPCGPEMVPRSASWSAPLMVGQASAGVTPVGVGVGVGAGAGAGVGVGAGMTITPSPGEATPSAPPAARLAQATPRSTPKHNLQKDSMKISGPDAAPKRRTDRKRTVDE